MERTEYYAMHQSEESLWWYLGLQDVLLRILERYRGDEKKVRVLDAGCGTGKNYELLSQQGFDVVGIDPSATAIKLCRQRGLRKVQTGDVTKLELPSSSFDIVLCLDVLGLLPNRQLRRQALSEMARVLKPGGILIMHCAALEWLRSPHDEVCHLYKRFSRAELKTMAVKESWQIEKLSYRVTLLLPLIATVKIIKRIVYRFTGVATSDQYRLPSIINSMLLALQKFENKLLMRLGLPVGSSLLMVAKRTK